MKITVIGCGYLGAVHAACMAKLGHEVLGIDVDGAKIKALTKAKAPFFEPKLPKLLSSAIASGRLRFSTDISEAADYDAHFIAVGTPQQAGSDAADMSFVDASVSGLLPYLKPGSLVIGKSTVPVGTARRLRGLVQAVQPEADVAWNPEFLREGFAVKDTLHPDRFVFGLPGDSDGPAWKAAKEKLENVYAKALKEATPVVVCGYETAELVKVSANAFLATKISFINAMSDVCDASGADVGLLANAIGFDSRIGRKFLNAGLGFGGGCLPKDIRAFQARAEELGVGHALNFLAEVDTINVRQRDRAVQIVTELVAKPLAETTVAVLGLAFKPNSDDVRDSPGLDVAARLHAAGATVVATDPQGVANARRIHPELDYAASFEEAVRGADAVVLATEWEQYRDLDPHSLDNLVAAKAILDARNCLSPAIWRAAGWAYRGFGRP